MVTATHITSAASTARRFYADKTGNNDDYNILKHYILVHRVLEGWVGFVLFNDTCSQ